MKLINHAEPMPNQWQHYDDLSQQFPTFDSAQDLLASDMDGTMFEEDLGVLVFVKKLQSPTFWSLTPEQFRRLILPKIYREVINDPKFNIPQEAKKRIITLASELSDIYAQMKNLIREGHQFSPEQPVLSEFILRMLEFDDLFMKYDKEFMPRTNGMFLSRTRFFMVKNLEDIKKITAEIFSSGQGQALAIQSNQADWEAHGLSPISEERQQLTVKLQTTVREDVLGIISRMINEEGIIHRAVVTANLQQTAQAAVNNSRYKQLFHPGAVWGSQLRIDGDKRVLPKMKSKPVYKQVKVDRILKEKPEKRIKVALGDTSGDIPMIMESLRNGGLGFFVQTKLDPEQTRTKAQSMLKETLETDDLAHHLGKDWEERMIYVLNDST